MGYTRTMPQTDTPSARPLTRTQHLDFPALDGRPVTQGHANMCTSKGHATHTVNGVDTGVCPRCGDVKRVSLVKATVSVGARMAALDATDRARHGRVELSTWGAAPLTAGAW